MSVEHLPEPVAISKGEQTRRAILDAAIVRFGRDGYRSTSVMDIAREASVGGTVAYAYFDNKEALFLAALDEDVAAVIREGVDVIEGSRLDSDWPQTMFFTLVAAVEQHPLARRMLAGLEPEVTDRVLEIPALAMMRAAVGHRLREEQATGLIRDDIDPEAIGNGIVSILLSLLMSVIQVGGPTVGPYAYDVERVFRAAIEPMAIRP